MRRLIPALVLACACACSAQPVDTGSNDRELAALERQVFQLVNNERTWRRLSALQWDERLTEEARRQARNMAERGFFSHVDPIRGDLPDRLKRAKIPWTHCAENLLQEQGYEDPARFAVLSWMKSPGHRKNILFKEVTRAGVGAARRADGTLFIAEVFTHP